MVSDLPGPARFSGGEIIFAANQPQLGCTNTRLAKALLSFTRRLGGMAQKRWCVRLSGISAIHESRTPPHGFIRFVIPQGNLTLMNFHKFFFGAAS